MTTHLGLQRILLPSAQVSSLTTGSITLPSRGLLAVPDAPTIGTATGGESSASVTFTAAATGTTATSFIVTSSPDGITGTGSSSPITVSGLTNGTAYTFTVAGINASGTGVQSAASNSVTPALQVAYESIQTIYLSSGTQSTLTFSSIPSTFTHLQLRGNLKSQRGSDFQSTIRLRVNGDSGNNYIYGRWQNQGSSANGFMAAGDPYLYWYNACTTNTGPATYSPSILDIFNYAKTNVYKTFQGISGVVYANTDSRSNKTQGAWASTSAITSITLDTDDGSAFSQYSRIGLYGIRGT
jgi:hypothetical protein